jgi:hypothetical protein
MEGRRRTVAPGDGMPGPSSEAGVQANPHTERLGCDGEGNISTEGHGFRLPRKASSQAKAPVPETDTGGHAEHAKARGRTLVKELGNMTP